MAIGSYDREELTELLEDRQFRKLRETMSEMNEVDIAEFIEELEPEKKVLVYRMLPKELAADVFSFLEVDDQEHIINSITDYELGKIVEDLYVDDAVDMLEELPGHRSQACITERNSGNTESDQSVLTIPGEQRRKHYDSGIYRPEAEYDRRTGLCVHPGKWCR